MISQTSQTSFALTEKQSAAWDVICGPAKHVLGVGGSRSGKTLLFLRAIVIRALAAARSRHAVLRYRFNHVMSSVVLDTWPKMMELCYPQVDYSIDKSYWYARLPNDSQIWFGGMDDKERAERILGNEYVSVFLNEISQIPLVSRNLAVTRLAQVAHYQRDGAMIPLRQKMFYDENPPSQAHWSYVLFKQHRDPETKQQLRDPSNYATFRLNPVDNLANLPGDYLQTLRDLSARQRLRFLEGEFAPIAENVLWNIEIIEQWRVLDRELPDMQRVVVAVDPSGAGDTDNTANDAIGIVVAGLGMDGYAYQLEDLTVKAGPKTWAGIAASAYDRHKADLIVAEKNFGGDMVRHVIQTAKPNARVRVLTASRGKVVRAEPIAALTEKGKIRFAGVFPALEDELCAFTTGGYQGTDSPNRADAFVWAMSELFPGIVREQDKPKAAVREHRQYAPGVGWMA